MARKTRSDGSAGDQEAGERCGKGEHYTFGEELPDQPAPRRTQRKADADFALPRHGARQHHLGDIGAGDQQNQAKAASTGKRTRNAWGPRRTDVARE